MINKFQQEFCSHIHIVGVSLVRENIDYVLNFRTYEVLSKNILNTENRFDNYSSSRDTLRTKHSVVGAPFEKSHMEQTQGVSF